VYTRSGDLVRHREREHGVAPTATSSSASRKSPAALSDDHDLTDKRQKQIDDETDGLDTLPTDIHKIYTAY
jgi:hypothetical protein